jgi:hypothetical protein
MTIHQAAVIVLGLIALSATAPRGAQPVSDPLTLLPDTSDRIIPFADQLRERTSDRFVRFVATRFAGAQKMRKAENERYRAVNPRWMLLHYRLGISSGPVPYIHNGDWGSDWSMVSAHEDWFLHNTAGSRHHHRRNNWDIHDIANPEFREYWVNSVVADMRATGAQGVFADSFEAGISSHGVTPPDPRFAGTGPADPAVWENGVTWLQRKLDFVDYVTRHFSATPEKFLFVPNLGGLTTTWWWPRYSSVDGAMLENFALRTTPDDWVLAMNRALELTRAGKLVIVESYPRNAGERLFLMASYLLIKGRRTFINAIDAGVSGVCFYPEYLLELGPALDPLPERISRYEWQGVYKREFRDAVVVVNASTVDVSVALPGPFLHVVPSGGGTIDDSHIDRDGRYVGGTLAEHELTTLQLPAQSAALLKRAP